MINKFDKLRQFSHLLNMPPTDIVCLETFDYHIVGIVAHENRHLFRDNSVEISVNLIVGYDLAIQIHISFVIWCHTWSLHMR